jgi:hypothetical protein
MTYEAYDAILIAVVTAAALVDIALIAYLFVVTR